MKHKTKTKHLEDTSQLSSRHANSDKTDQSQPREGVRRSTRKRSAPKNFVVTSKKDKGLYWGTAEKEKLLKVLHELNNQQLGTALYYSKNRYPIKLIQRKIGNKSMASVKKYLRNLERRAAGMMLSQMRHHAPLQSWRLMADKLTALTSDNCSRQLIRVCSILALESKDEEEESSVKENDGKEKPNIPTSSITPETGAPVAVGSTQTNHTNNQSTSTEIVSPNTLVSAGEIAMTTSCHIETESRSSPSASSVTSAATQPKQYSAADRHSSTTETGQYIFSTSPTRDKSSITAAKSDSSSTAARDNCSTVTLSAASTDISSATTSTTESGSTSAATSSSAATDNSLVNASKPVEINELQLHPDYVAIYKYFSGLMQGEQKELGELESLVVLDCLKTVEKHLVARNNTKQKKFVQKRFLDILENLYLSIDGETARKSEGGTMEEETDFGNAVTMADLMGSSNQSQAKKCQNDQSKASLSDNSHSASSSSVGQSASSTLQGQSTSTNKRTSREIPTRLGSLNPFGIPAKLLEIRQDT